MRVDFVGFDVRNKEWEWCIEDRNLMGAEGAVIAT